MCGSSPAAALLGSRMGIRGNVPLVWARRQVVELVQECLQRGGGSEAAEACAELINESASRWRQNEGAYRDDISCIVLRLPCFDAIVSAPSGGSPGAAGAAAATAPAGASAATPASSGDNGDVSPA